MKNFLNISEISSSELRLLIDEAKSRKLDRKNLNKSEPDLDKPLNGKSMIMCLCEACDLNNNNFRSYRLAAINL